jgi:adenine-specific DNA-methyltransferase
VSRLTHLIAQAKAKDPQLGADLEKEFKVLADRLSFGLNFERHQPEEVELPERPVRKGDKVRVLPPRGSTKRGDQRLWRVKKIEEVQGKAVACLELLRAEEQESQTVPVEDLVVVAEFRDMIYPGLVSTGKVERGGDKPYHTVINGENYHALKALTYTHRGKVDVIYIDPPYNTGARDWKYNNDYVEKEDLYRHSKWLAFMERRLLIAKELLNPADAVLIITIDEKEYLRLGLLLDQTFSEANIQMVSITISPRGTNRPTEFSRVDEYAYFVFLGDAVPGAREVRSGEDAEVRWQYLRRDNRGSERAAGRPRQFYPVFVASDTGLIHSVGEPLKKDESRHDVQAPLGTVPVFPVKSDGTEMVWGLTPPALSRALEASVVRLTPSSSNPHQPYTISYVTNFEKNLASGEIEVTGEREDGSKIVVVKGGRIARTSTVWREPSHDAGAYGTSLLSALLRGRAFPFPKSLYAVEDSLRVAASGKPDAIVLDFFSGSGTTAHAVMRLNRQDGGRRQCILVTNNEVSAEEQAALRKAGLRPGDPHWEKWGICDYITKPRVEAAITGKTPSGEPIKGDYKFTDEFPMAEGFEENAEFFTLTYETPVEVSHDLAFSRIAPLLWMRAGSQGRRIDVIPAQGWDVADAYGLLHDLDQADAFCAAAAQAEGLKIAFIVTDDDRRFQAVARRLPEAVEAVRLYESYLSNFRFVSGD